jgi:hypothetical protein
MATRFPELHDREFLLDTQGLTATQVATQVGCSRKSVYDARNKAGIPSGSVGRMGCRWLREGTLHYCQHYAWCDTHRDGLFRCQVTL